MTWSSWALAVALGWLVGVLMTVGWYARPGMRVYRMRLRRRRPDPNATAAAMIRAAGRGDSEAQYILRIAEAIVEGGGQGADL